MNASTTTRLLRLVATAAIEREKNFFFEEKVYIYPLSRRRSFGSREQTE
jgi:hypothetical protein